jgi:rubredoxin
MLRCPRCKTLKSVFSKKRKKIDVVEYKAEMHCSVCGHIWNRPFHGFGGGADGGG